MPRVVVTEGALRGLEYCRRFLTQKSSEAARRAAQAILRQFEMLERDPAMGRPLEDIPELGELLIPFGDSGYVALYRYDASDDAIYILAFRHQKEAGY